MVGDCEPVRNAPRQDLNRSDGGVVLHETLRAGAGTALVRRFHAWRGRSGRRYVVSAYERDCVPDYAGIVALAVRREHDGQLSMLGAVAQESADGPLMGGACFAAADEVHLHLLAADPAERAAIAADLGGHTQVQ